MTLRVVVLSSTTKIFLAGGSRRSVAAERALVLEVGADRVEGSRIAGGEDGLTAGLTVEGAVAGGVRVTKGIDRAVTGGRTDTDRGSGAAGTMPNKRKTSGVSGKLAEAAPDINTLSLENE